MSTKKIVAREILIFWSGVIFLGLCFLAFVLYKNHEEKKLTLINEEISLIEGAKNDNSQFKNMSDEELKKLFLKRMTFDVESFIAEFFKTYAPEKVNYLDEERIKAIYKAYLNEPDSLIGDAYFKYTDKSLSQEEIDSIKSQFERTSNTMLSRNSHVEILHKLEELSSLERINSLRNTRKEILSSKINLSVSDFFNVISIILVIVIYPLRFIVLSITWAVRVMANKI